MLSLLICLQDFSKGIRLEELNVLLGQTLMVCNNVMYIRLSFGSFI